jgi:hypothetical protein
MSITGTIVTNASLKMYFTLNLPIRKLSASSLNHNFSPRVAKVCDLCRIPIKECTANAVTHGMFVENRRARHPHERGRTHGAANRKKAMPSAWQRRKLLPAKLQRLQPLNIFALIRDDLRLPD